MPKKMLIDATHAEETRVVVVDGNKVEEFDFESQFKRQLAGNIYLAKVTRVEPSLQAAFVDYGGNRHGFLAFSEIHADYYQIPVADRQALIEEERAYAESLKAAEDEEETSAPRRRRSRNAVAEDVSGDDAVSTEDVEIAGMETIDLSDDDEGSSPMERGRETPVDTPAADEDDTDADNGDTDEDSDNNDDDGPDAADKDDRIEQVADNDHDDMRPVRKPRPKRYKIQEVIKVRQILLVQVVKEERGNKGAALTTYLSLAGRYCVLMPNTARGGGISRKITNAADRKKLKEIAGEMHVPQGAGLIIRTAGSQRTRTEIKRDYEYLQRMWEQIRELTLKSTAPAKIYEEGDLIKRTIRDLYSKDIDEVIVAGTEGYRTAKDFMKMIMPSHAKNVKHYAEQMPLYARYQVESYLAGMFNPTVQLPSGGYIVIGITEALVAIDVNSGRATKEGSIEQTALKTNLEAADEVARQLRLRDLAGLIVIDFIDMDERRNNAAVEKRFKDKLKNDRARIQVGRISGFGLMEMSRQRLRPGMLEATTQPCVHCHGTGLLRSDDNVALNIIRQLEEEGVRGRSKEVLVRAPVSIANFLMNGKREHIAAIEARYGMAVRVECDLKLISPEFAIDKFKSATRVVPEAGTYVQAESAMIEEDDDEDIVEETPEEDEADAPVATPAAPTPQADDTENQPRKKRRRRRRRRGGQGGDDRQDDDSSNDSANGADNGADAETADATPDAATAADDAPAEKPKRTRTRSRKPKADASVNTDASTVEASEAAPQADATPDASTDAPAAETESDAPKKRTRTRRKPAAKADGDAATETADAPADAAAEKPKPKRRSRAKKPQAADEATPTAEQPAAQQSDDSPPAASQPDPAPATPAQADQEPADATPAEPAPAAQDPAPETKGITEVPEVQPEREPVAADAADSDTDDKKPRRKGWWSLGR
ncbi:ribonuclease E/G [Loktanella sp. SALINAS62]|uniref:Rne/Rng family ribonuclease n=1 Tax=Loktanella sp. SALINAS62 TaxID=2706124 RepID=UPI001B8B3251|nr:ribonuclease E/G [Loktanella sp. SALINAS62]MBS1302844.1 Rne/Rng family ribonuclease [Loktanella sp. SALINAS62]